MEQYTEWTAPERRLFEALRAALGGERITWDEGIPADEWGALLALSHRQKLLPIVIGAVFACPAAKSAEECIAPFRQSARRQVLTQTMRSLELFPLFRFLSDRGLHPLVVKGAVCRALYPNPDDRQSTDEDLLIPEEEFSSCCEAMREYGMTIPDPKADGEDAFERTFLTENRLLTVELHRALFPPDSSALDALNAPFSRVWESARDYPVEGGVVRSLCPHDHLLYLIFHAYKHFIHSGFGLRQVCDIGLWAKEYRSEIDWRRLYEQCAAVRAQKFAAAVFRIAEDTLGLGTICPEFWASAADPTPMLHDLLSGGVYGATDLTHLHSGSVTLDAVNADRRGQRPRLRTVLFPSRAALSQRYPVLKKHPVLLPAMWGDRLVRYAAETLSPSKRSDAGESLKIAGQRLELMRKYDILD